MKSINDDRPVDKSGMSPVLNLTMGMTAKIVLVLAIIVYLRPRRSDYISLRYHLNSNETD